MVDLGIPNVEEASTLKVGCQHIIWPVSPEIKRACTTCTQRGVHIPSQTNSQQLLVENSGRCRISELVGANLLVGHLSVKTAQKRQELVPWITYMEFSANSIH